MTNENIQTIINNNTIAALLTIAYALTSKFKTRDEDSAVLVSSLNFQRFPQLDVSEQFNAMVDAFNALCTETQDLLELNKDADNADVDLTRAVTELLARHTNFLLDFADAAGLTRPDLEEPTKYDRSTKYYDYDKGDNRPLSEFTSYARAVSTGESLDLKPYEINAIARTASFAIVSMLSRDETLSSWIKAANLLRQSAR